MSTTNPRKAHVKRIYAQDASGANNPDVWVDVLRIDKALVSDKPGAVPPKEYGLFSLVLGDREGQGTYLYVKWEDKTKEKANPARKTEVRNIVNPQTAGSTTGGATDPNNTVPLDIIKSMKFTSRGRPDGMTVTHKWTVNDNPADSTSDPDNDGGPVNARRKGTTVRVPHNDLGGGLDMTSPVLWDDYLTALQAGATDSSQYVDMEILQTFTVQQKPTTNQVAKITLHNDDVLKQFSDSPDGTVGVRLDPLQMVVNVSWAIRYAIISGFPTVIDEQSYTVLWMGTGTKTDGKTPTLVVKYKVLAFTDQGENLVLNHQTGPETLDTVNGTTSDTGPFLTQLRAVTNARMDYYGTTTAVPNTLFVNEVMEFEGPDTTNPPPPDDFTAEQTRYAEIILYDGGVYNDAVTDYSAVYKAFFLFYVGRNPIFPDDDPPPGADNPEFDAYLQAANAAGEARFDDALSSATIQPVAPYTFWDKKAVQLSSYTPPDPVVGKIIYSDGTVTIRATQSAVTVHEMRQGSDAITQTISNTDLTADSIIDATFVGGFLYIAMGGLVYPNVASIFRYELAFNQLVKAGQVDPAYYGTGVTGQFAYDTDSDISMYVLHASGGFGHLDNHNTFTLTKTTRDGAQVYSVDISASLYSGPARLDPDGPTVGHIGKMVWVGSFLVTQRIVVRDDQTDDDDLLFGYDSYVVWFNAKDGSLCDMLLWGSTTILPEDDSDPAIFDTISAITATDKLPADPTILPDSDPS